VTPSEEIILSIPVLLMCPMRLCHNFDELRSAVAAGEIGGVGGVGGADMGGEGGVRVSPAIAALCRTVLSVHLAAIS
jgi:hypothetical protein